MQALYSPSGSLKERLFGASQKHIELWKVSGANYAAGWRSQDTRLKPKINSVPRAALESLHSRMQSPRSPLVCPEPAHLQCNAGMLSLGSLRRTQVSGQFWVFLRAAPSVQVADQLWLDHLQNFMWKIKAVSYPSVLKLCPCWLGPRHFAEHFWLQCTIFKYDQSIKAQGESKETNISDLQCWWWQWKWKKFRETYRLLCTQFTSVHNSLQPAKQLKTTTCFISCHVP